MLRADFHTHTNFCDGQNTPREMVEAAYQMGLTDYGVSGHAWFPYGWDGGMGEAAFAQYKKDLYALKEEYAGKMNVYIGVELDALGPIPEAEYLIGSIHCLKKDGEYVMIDSTEQVLKSAVDRLWGGDWYALTRDYYEMEAGIYETTGCDFIGHFDLITKFNQDYKYFDESKAEYLKPAFVAIKKLTEEGIPFEINTGAISRGYRKEPYPSPFLLKELKRLGGRIMINSDSHSTQNICYKFDLAIELAKSCGFTHSCVLKPGGGFREVFL